MTNPYYVSTGTPSTGAFAASAPMRSEFDDIQAGFNLLPALTAGTAVVVNSAGTALGNTVGRLALAGNFTTTGAFNLTVVVGATVSLTAPLVSGTIATLDGTETLTNKTINGSANTLTNIGNASLTNSSLTINGSSVSLGGSVTVTAAASSVVVGSTTISSGTTTRVLYDNAGTLGEYAVSGSGSVAMTTSPVFTTPNLGTPSAVVLTSGTGLPISSGVSGLGTGVATALAVNTGSAGAVVLFNGAGGTPSSMTATNLTGTAAGLTAGTASAVAVGGITGLGTGVATALAVNIGSAGAFVTFNGALGTPSTGTATNLTGLPLTTGVTGTLPYGNGGTGATSFTQHGVVVAGASALSTVAPGTSGNVLTSNGTDWTSSAAGGGITIGTTTITSGTTTRILYDNAGVVGEYTISGSGTVVAMAASPVFTGPTLGVATATSINGLVISTTTGTLTMTNAKTLAVTATLTLSGTDSTTMTFPSTSGTVVTLAATQTLTNKTYDTSGTGNVFYAAMIPQGRLSLVTGVPVMVSAQTGKATVFYCLYTGNLVPIYDGTSYKWLAFTELSNDLTASSTGNAGPAAAGNNSNYDLFVWANSGTPTLTRGPLWTSDTGRGTGAGTTQITRVNGIYTNTVAITNGPGAGLGTYVGTIRTDGSAQTNWQPGGAAGGGTAALLNVWNAYNRVECAGIIQDTTANWSYTTATWRPTDNSTAVRASFIMGLQEDFFETMLISNVLNSTTGVPSNGINFDSTNATPGGVSGSYFGNTTSTQANIVAQAELQSLGFHFAQGMEYSTAAGATTWYGTTNGANIMGLSYRGRF